MKLLISFLITFAAYSHADIRGVGKGGGFAEMQAYAFDKEFPVLAKLCTAKFAACGLTSDESDLLKLYLAKYKDFPDQTLKINVTCAHPFLHAEVEGTYSIDSCALYEDDQSTQFGPTPKQVAEIAKLVVTARLLELNAENQEAVTALARKLVSQLQSSEFTNFFTAGEVLARLTVWNLSLNGLERKFLMLETQQESVDLTGELEKNIGCPANPWRLGPLKFTSVDAPTTQAIGDMNWKCEAGASKGILTMSFTFKERRLESHEMVILNRE